MTGSTSTQYARSIAFLLSQTGARSAQLFTEELAPLETTPRAFAILSHLEAGEPQTQQQLADRLAIHRNNMVGLIDDLEAAGWVHRHRSSQDRRAFEIHITEEGRAIVASVNSLVPTLDEQLAGGLSPAERRTLVSLLSRVAERLELTPAVHPELTRRAHTGTAAPS